MPIIWFIRHAESETNVGLPTASPLIAQLTPAGIEQAHCIAHAFSTPPQLIVTSAYVRTQQTAEPTLQRFPATRVEVWPVHEFTYLSQSLGSEPTTIVDRRLWVDAYWERLDHSYRDGDGAESFAQFMQRVQDVVERLKKAD
jgi:2,3-bisphosphoglycerate-dependent phosphoglycerate mutase